MIPGEIQPGHRFMDGRRQVQVIALSRGVALCESFDVDRERARRVRIKTRRLANAKLYTFLQPHPLDGIL